MVNQKINEEQAREIKKLYLKGQSTVMLAKRYDVGHRTIRRWLMRQNVEIRSASEAGKLASKKGRLFGQHEIPDSSREMTSGKAYILGVMCGDGYLHKAKHSYQIGLQAVDTDFVQEFARCMESVYGIKPSIREIPARKQNWSDKLQARTCSKAVFRDIKSYGKFRSDAWDVPREILGSSIPTKSKFLKGVFDSEGSVDAPSRRLSAVSICINGIRSVQELLESIGIRSVIQKQKVRGNRKQLYIIRIQDRKSVEIFYKYIGFVIRRKQESLENLVNSYKFWSITNEESKRISPKIKRLRDKKLTYEEIGRRLGISPATAWRHVNKEVNS